MVILFHIIGTSVDEDRWVEGQRELTSYVFSGNNSTTNGYMWNETSSFNGNWLDIHTIN